MTRDGILLCLLRALPAILPALFVAWLIWSNYDRVEHCSKACAPHSFTIGTKNRCVCDLTTKVVE